jgi:hypothetical protein
MLFSLHPITASASTQPRHAKKPDLRTWLKSGFFVKMVGVRGFELLTSCSQSRRATGLRYTPMKLFKDASTSRLRCGANGIRSVRFGPGIAAEAKNGGSCGIRTYDQLVKSQLLYQLS